MSDPDASGWSEPLTKRELEILRLISEGFSNREIAQRLYLSIDTVKWYNKQLFSKLGVSSRIQAAKTANRYLRSGASADLTSQEEIRPYHNLPLQLTSFLSREFETKQIVGMLTPLPGAGRELRPRLVTITGPGGVGKTRLAIQAAAELLSIFPDGVWLVDLAPLADPARVPQTVAAVLGLRDESNKPLPDELISYLRSKTTLIVLDNCEHIIDACAQLAASALNACPNISILATSREAMGIPGEISFPLSPLPVPDPELPVSRESLLEYGAVRLFVDRAQSAQPDFSLTSVNSPSVAEICRRLDGLPLAIELAAARVKVLTVAQIADRLADTFHLLGFGSRTAPLKSQTLHTCIDWSYNLLSEAERLLLNRLAVFAGGWTLEAAEGICADERIHSPEVLSLLAQLVDKSLVVVEHKQTNVLRYRFLETIYQFVLEKYNSSGESTVLKDKHLEYFLHYIERRDKDLAASERVDWLNRVEAEHDNLRAALEWSLSASVDRQLCFRLAMPLGEFWDWRGYLDEGRDSFSKVLTKPGFSDLSLERAELLFQNAWFAIYQSDIQGGLPLLEESRSIYRKLHPQGMRGEADVLNSLASIEIDSGEARDALKHAQMALEIAEEINYLQGVSWAHHMLGVALGHLGEYEPAWKHLETSLELNTRVGRSSISLLSNLGELAVRQGDDEKGMGYLQQSLELARQAKDKWNIAANLGTQGWIALRQGNIEQARQLLEESIAVRGDIGDKGGIAWCLEKLARAACLKGSADKAVSLLAAATRLRLEVNSPVNSADKQEYDQLLASLHELIDQDAFRASWEQGMEMPAEAAINLALEV